jgi:hypothetical protein
MPGDQFGQVPGAPYLPRFLRQMWNRTDFPPLGSRQLANSLTSRQRG